MKEIIFTFNPKEEQFSYVKFASGIVHRASEFVSDMLLSSNGRNKVTNVDLKSILGVMSLHQGIGQEFKITIEGKDEDLAYMSLESYVKNI